MVGWKKYPGPEIGAPPAAVCPVLPEHDACLMGQWRLDQGALETLVNTEGQNDFNPPAVVDGDAVFSFFGDGQSTLAFTDMELRFGTDRKVVALYDLTVSGTTKGGWSTGPVTGGGWRDLQSCAPGNSVKVSVAVQVFTGGQTVKSSTSEAFGDAAPLRYQCSADQLILKYRDIDTGANGVPIKWVLHRIK